MDTKTGLLRVTPEQFGNIRSLIFTIGDVSIGSELIPSSAIVRRSLTSPQTSFEFIPNAQAWPRQVSAFVFPMDLPRRCAYSSLPGTQLNAAIGGSSNYVYLIVADFGLLGALLGPGISFINGMSFLERFYHVYDATNNRVGFATTNYTYALIN